jgi:hypothetical protein
VVWAVESKWEERWCGRCGAVGAEVVVCDAERMVIYRRRYSESFA